jgi:hypothetical protein
MKGYGIIYKSTMTLWTVDVNCEKPRCVSVKREGLGLI